MIIKKNKIINPERQWGNFFYSLLRPIPRLHRLIGITNDTRPNHHQKTEKSGIKLRFGGHHEGGSVVEWLGRRT